MQSTSVAMVITIPFRHEDSKVRLLSYCQVVKTALLHTPTPTAAKLPSTSLSFGSLRQWGHHILSLLWEQSCWKHSWAGTSSPRTPPQLPTPRPPQPRLSIRSHSNLGKQERMTLSPLLCLLSEVSLMGLTNFRETYFQRLHLTPLSRNRSGNVSNKGCTKRQSQTQKYPFSWINRAVWFFLRPLHGPTSPPFVRHTKICSNPTQRGPQIYL